MTTLEKIAEAMNDFSGELKKHMAVRREHQAALKLQKRLSEGGRLAKMEMELDRLNNLSPGPGQDLGAIDQRKKELGRQIAFEQALRSPTPYGFN